ncbi:MAG: hypothetical protein PF501_07610 [Salinisphaera sp.]|jgi:hypothetical protein|nr:hypothetical protein [Salinisphaera sp.]
MNHTIIDATPMEAAACRLLIACMRASEHSGRGVRFTYHNNPVSDLLNVGGTITTQLNRADLYGQSILQSTKIHSPADIDRRAHQIAEQLLHRETRCA